MERMQKIIEFLEKRYGPKIKKHRWKDPFKVLIGCVLSQRTREENTERAANSLFSVACEPKEILKIHPKGLERLIRSSGMYKQKAKRTREICKILLKEYGGKVPRTREELMKLPGVGPKTADITLCYGHGIPSIAVDVHCERIPKRLGLVERTADVEEVKRKLENLIPKEKWYLMNLGMVRFGRETCKPRNPRCDVCPIKSLCKKSLNP